MTKPDALALADRLRFTAEAWIEGLTVTKEHMPTPEMLLEAVAELRRLQAEVEALRKYKAAAHLIAEDAGRFQWMQDHALAIDTVADPDNQVQIWHGTDPARCTYGRTLSEAIDAAMKEQTND